MNNRRVRNYLRIAIAVMAILPFSAAFFLLNHTLQTSLNLGFNPEIAEHLSDSVNNLKALKKLDPKNELEYHRQFESVQTLNQIYGNPEVIHHKIKNSLIFYFSVGFLITMVFSFGIATLLSRKIAQSYDTLFRELELHRDKVRYLEEIATWQDLAKMLAHEIKNPLTPIDIAMSALSKALAVKPKEEFEKQLQLTQTIVQEELQHLKIIVNKFSEFSKLPKVQLQKDNLVSVVRQYLPSVQQSFANAEIVLDVDDVQSTAEVLLDAALIKQILINIIRNGIEANPNQRVTFRLQVKSSGPMAMDLSIANNGVPVPPALAKRIFEPYVSGKSGKDNMGLGLAVVRKIMIEHGGDIHYEEVSGAPVFSMKFKRAI